MAKITDAYTTDAGETPAIHASAVGATMAKITDAYTTDAGETPAFHASATGATMAKITDAYTTDAGETPGRMRCAAWQPPKALCNAKSAGVLACETLGVGNYCDTLGGQEEG